MKVSNIWKLFRIVLIICRYNKIKSDKIAEELEISPRQVYRYISCLKYAGIPIYSDKNGYSIFSDFLMPRISLNLQETATLLLFINSIQMHKGTPYYQFLNSACEKIISSLPGNLKKIVLENRFNGMIDFGLEAKINYKETENIFNAIYDAQLDKKSISVKYFGMERKETLERIIDPYSVKFRYGVWYLIGYCHLRNEIRIFRVDRIKEIKILDNKFTIPDDFSLDSFLGGSWGIKKVKGLK